MGAVIFHRCVRIRVTNPLACSQRLLPGGKSPQLEIGFFLRYRYYYCCSCWWYSYYRYYCKRDHARISSSWHHFIRPHVSRQGQRAGPERREKERRRQIHRSPARTEAINWPLVPAVPRQTLTIYYLHLGDHPSQLPPRRTAGVNVMDCIPETFLRAFFLFLTLFLSLSLFCCLTRIWTHPLWGSENMCGTLWGCKYSVLPLRAAHLACIMQIRTVYLVEFTVSATWLNLFDWQWSAREKIINGMPQRFDKKCQTCLLECLHNW